MDQNQIEQAARLLYEARRETRLIDEIPESYCPRSLTEAYAIRDRLIELIDEPIAGFFCGATNDIIQSMLQLQEPYYAYLLDEHIYSGPAELDASRYPPMVLECEFGFHLGADLPARDEPYTRAEVAGAVDSVHPTIEVVAGHLENWPMQDVFSVIADNGTDGALICGVGATDWQELDLVNMAVTLSVNGKQMRGGRGRSVLGDPVDSFVWLVNALSRDGHTLEADQICNTGTATEICFVGPGDEAQATFEGLGTVALKVIGEETQG